MRRPPVLDGAGEPHIVVEVAIRVKAARPVTHTESPGAPAGTAARLKPQSVARPCIIGFTIWSGAQRRNGMGIPFMRVVEELLQSLRLADVFDIAFVAMFVYALLAWFKQTATRSVLVGLLVLTGVYLVARATNMYMTTGIFQAGLAVVLFALIVVFQEDIRRAFERLAFFGELGHRRSAWTRAEYIDTVSQSAFELAAKRVGGLFVLKGSEALERHIQGGIPLEGKISKPLVDSIFDPSSMGHDGAVIIENDRIRRFAAHLPLSKNVDELGTRGTRHAAGLGLSEVSDALVIVVSEERGEVSVAESGRFGTVNSAAALNHRIDAFHRKHFAPRRRKFWRDLAQRDAHLKLLALVLSCVAWYLLIYEAEIIQKNFVVPIEYRNLPETLAIQTSRPSEARITLSGYENAFSLLDPNALRVSLNVEDVKKGRQVIAIENADVKMPKNLTLTDVDPDSVFLVVASQASTTDRSPG